MPMNVGKDTVKQASDCVILVLEAGFSRGIFLPRTPPCPVSFSSPFRQRVLSRPELEQPKLQKPTTAVGSILSDEQ